MCVYLPYTFSCAELQEDPIISPEPSESENVWVTFAYGFVAVTIINLSSIGGLMIVPLMNKRAYHRGRFSFTPMLTQNKHRDLDKIIRWRDLTKFLAWQPMIHGP